MRVRPWAAVAAVTSLATAASAQAPPPKPASTCKIGLVGEMKVEFRRNRPTITGAINGQPVRVLIDTGAFASMLFTAKARELHLPLRPVNGLRLSGAGGVSEANSAVLDELEVAGVTRHGFNILVAGEGGARDTDMIMGQDVFGRFDLEFDLKHNALRLLTLSGCDDDQAAYWVNGAYSMAPMLDGPRDKIYIHVKLNGHTLRAELDSGAQTSVATLRAAQVASVPLTDSDIVGRGIGAEKLQNKLGTLDTFTVGDETIKSTKLRFSDLFSAAVFENTGSHIGARPDDLPEMLLGADFLKSHRVLISRSRKRVYFSYEGGPVFDIYRPQPPAAPAQTPAAPQAAAASAPPGS